MQKLSNPARHISRVGGRHGPDAPRSCVLVLQVHRARAVRGRRHYRRADRGESAVHVKMGGESRTFARGAAELAESRAVCRLHDRCFENAFGWTQDLRICGKHGRSAGDGCLHRSARAHARPPGHRFPVCRRRQRHRKICRDGRA